MKPDQTWLDAFDLVTEFAAVLNGAPANRPPKPRPVPIGPYAIVEQGLADARAYANAALASIDNAYRFDGFDR